MFYTGIAKGMAQELLGVNRVRTNSYHFRPILRFVAFISLAT